MTESSLYKLLEDLGIEKLKRVNHNIMGSSPFAEDNNPSWGISVNDPHLWNCFATGKKGNLVQLLIEVGNYSFFDAKRTIGEDPNVSLIPFLESRESLKTLDRNELYPFMLPDHVAAYVRIWRRLKQRTLRQADLLYDDKNNRVLFSWFKDGDLICVTGRSLYKNEAAKTIPYFGSVKKNSMYLPLGYIREDPFVVVEGEFSALKVYDSGFQNVGAIGSGTISQKQLEQIKLSSTNEIVVMSDDDTTGKDIFKTINKALGECKKVRHVDYSLVRHKYSEEKLDPNDLVKKDIQILYKAKTDLVL